MYFLVLCTSFLHHSIQKPPSIIDQIIKKKHIHILAHNKKNQSSFSANDKNILAVNNNHDKLSSLSAPYHPFSPLQQLPSKRIYKKLQPPFSQDLNPLSSYHFIMPLKIEKIKVPVTKKRLLKTLADQNERLNMPFLFRTQTSLSPFALPSFRFSMHIIASPKGEANNVFLLEKIVGREMSSFNIKQLHKNHLSSLSYHFPAPLLILEKAHTTALPQLSSPTHPPFFFHNDQTYDSFLMRTAPVTLIEENFFIQISQKIPKKISFFPKSQPCQKGALRVRKHQQFLSSSMTRQANHINNISPTFTLMPIKRRSYHKKFPSHILPKHYFIVYPHFPSRNHPSMSLPPKDRFNSSRQLFHSNPFTPKHQPCLTIFFTLHKFSQFPSLPIRQTFNNSPLSILSPLPLSPEKPSCLLNPDSITQQSLVSITQPLSFAFLSQQNGTFLAQSILQQRQLPLLPSSEKSCSVRPFHIHLPFFIPPCHNNKTSSHTNYIAQSSILLKKKIHLTSYKELFPLYIPAQSLLKISTLSFTEGSKKGKIKCYPHSKKNSHTLVRPPFSMKTYIQKGPFTARYSTTSFFSLFKKSLYIPFSRNLSNPTTTARSILPQNHLLDSTCQHRTSLKNNLSLLPLQNPSFYQSPQQRDFFASLSSTPSTEKFNRSQKITTPYNPQMEHLNHYSCTKKKLSFLLLQLKNTTTNVSHLSFALSSTKFKTLGNLTANHQKILVAIYKLSHTKIDLTTTIPCQSLIQRPTQLQHSLTRHPLTKSSDRKFFKQAFVKPKITISSRIQKNNPAHFHILPIFFTLSHIKQTSSFKDPPTFLTKHNTHLLYDMCNGHQKIAASKMRSPAHHKRQKIKINFKEKMPYEPLQQPISPPHPSIQQSWIKSSTRELSNKILKQPTITTKSLLQKKRQQNFYILPVFFTLSHIKQTTLCEPLHAPLKSHCIQLQWSPPSAYFLLEKNFHYMYKCDQETAQSYSRASTIKYHNTFIKTSQELPTIKTSSTVKDLYALQKVFVPIHDVSYHQFSVELAKNNIFLHRRVDIKQPLLSPEFLSLFSYRDEINTEIAIFADPNQKDLCQFVITFSDLQKLNNAITPLCNHIYFLLDQSSAIASNQFYAFKQGIFEALRYLTTPIFFQIITFNQKTWESVQMKEIQKAFFSDHNLREILQQIHPSTTQGSSLKVFLSAIQYIQQKAQDNPNEFYTLILFSNGNFLQYSKQNRKDLSTLLSLPDNLSLHSVTIGYKNDDVILECLAKLGRGEYFSSPSYISFPRKFAAFLKLRQNPLITHSLIQCIHPAQNDITSFLLYKNRSPMLFANKSISIYGETRRTDDLYFILQAKSKDKWINIVKRCSLCKHENNVVSSLMKKNMHKQCAFMKFIEDIITYKKKEEEYYSFLFNDENLHLY